MQTNTTFSKIVKKPKQDNAQIYIKSQFDYISENMPESQKEYKPSIVINHGSAKTKHIAITWQEFEQIKQYLINSAKDE